MRKKYDFNSLILFRILLKEGNSMAFVFRATKNQNLNLSTVEHQFLPKGFADEIKEKNSKKKHIEIEHHTQQKTEASDVAALVRQNNYAQLEYLLVNNNNSLFGSQSIKFNITTKKQEPLSSVFKSNTIREILPNKPTDSPGPGHYNFQNDTTLNTNKKNAKNSSVNTTIRSNCTNTIDLLPSVPSIPDMKKKFGYKTQDKKLILNVDPFLKYSGIGNDKPGPGQYSTQSPKRILGVDFHKSKAKRDIFETKMSNVDQVVESSYITQIPYNYKCQNSSSFKLTQQRSLFASRSEKVLNKIFKKATADTDITRQNTCSDSEEEYIEDSVPGPGHYNANQSSFITKDFRSKKKQIRKIFISQQQRLKQKKIQTKVGPTTYSAQISTELPPSNLKGGFLSGDSRFKQPKPSIQAQVGSYRPRNTLQDNLINKLLKGSKGKFGTNATRFQQKQNTLPGPGVYQQNIFSLEKISNMKNTLQAAYKSQVKRQIFVNNPKQKRPSPTDYNYDHPQETSELQEELKPKKAPFCSTEQRFPEKIVILEQQKKYPIKPRYDHGQKVTRVIAPFLSQCQRFPPPPLEQTPAVGQFYNPEQASRDWQIRSFNVLFNNIS